MRNKVIECIKEILGKGTEINVVGKESDVIKYSIIRPNYLISFFGLLEGTNSVFMVSHVDLRDKGKPTEVLQCVASNEFGVVKEVIESLLVRSYGEEVVSTSFYDQVIKSGKDVIDSVVMGEYGGELLAEFDIQNREVNEKKEFLGDVVIREVQDHNSEEIEIRVLPNGVVFTTEISRFNCVDIIGLLKFVDGEIQYTSLKYKREKDKKRAFLLESLPNILVEVTSSDGFYKDQLTLTLRDRKTSVGITKLDSRVIKEIVDKTGVTKFNYVETNELDIDSLRPIFELTKRSGSISLNSKGGLALIDDIGVYEVPSDDIIWSITIDAYTVDANVIDHVKRNAIYVNIISHYMEYDNLKNMVKAVGDPQDGENSYGRPVTDFNIVSSILPKDLFDDSLTNSKLNLSTFDIDELIEMSYGRKYTKTINSDDDDTSGNNLLIDSSTLYIDKASSNEIKIKSIPQIENVTVALEENSVIDFGIGTIKNITESFKVAEELLYNTTIIRDSMRELHPGLETLMLGGSVVINSNTTYEMLSKVNKELFIDCPNLLNGNMNVLNHELSLIDIHSSLNSYINVEDFKKLEILNVANTKITGVSSSITSLLLRGYCDISGLTIKLEEGKSYRFTMYGEVEGFDEFIKNIKSQLKDRKINISIYLNNSEIIKENTGRGEAEANITLGR